MKYEEKYQDLFVVNSDLSEKEQPYCLAHCISADFGMFGGIVVEFNNRWNMKHRLLKKYGDQQKDFKNHGAAVFPESVLDYGHPIFVYNLVTKPTVAHRPTYKDLGKSLRLMKTHMVALGCTKLAIPTIGCGIDGLDWNTVKDMIQEIFEDTDIDILVCRR